MGYYDFFDLGKYANLQDPAMPDEYKRFVLKQVFCHLDEKQKIRWQTKSLHRVYQHSKYYRDEIDVACEVNQIMLSLDKSIPGMKYCKARPIDPECIVNDVLEYHLKTEFLIRVEQEEPSCNIHYFKDFDEDVPFYKSIIEQRNRETLKFYISVRDQVQRDKQCEADRVKKIKDDCNEQCEIEKYQIEQDRKAQRKKDKLALKKKAAKKAAKK